MPDASRARAGELKPIGGTLPPAAELAVSVEAPFRGRGVGTELCRRLLVRARDRDGDSECQENPSGSDDRNRACRSGHARNKAAVSSGQTGDGPPGRPEERTVSSLLIGCSALESSAPGATAGPSWWERLARRIANEYRIRRAEREVAVLDERTRRDIGLEYTARFGRA